MHEPLQQVNAPADTDTSTKFITISGSNQGPLNFDVDLLTNVTLTKASEDSPSEYFVDT